MDLVVAKYKEDVLWLKQLKGYRIFIYNKDNEDKTWPYNLPNYGKDAHTHLHHIVENYDKLGNYTAFLQGNPFDHCPNTVDYIKNFNFKDSFMPLGPVYERDIQDFITSTENYCKTYNISYSLPFNFIGGMQLILSREQIHKRSKDFYAKLRESIPKRISEGSGIAGNSDIIWWLEYSWPTVFNINEEIKKYIR